MPNIDRSTLESLRLDTKPRKPRSGWHNTALLVEALLVLVILVTCLGVFTRLFSYAYSENAYDGRRAQAITLAVNQAELFASDPQTAAGTSQDNGYTTTCIVTQSKTGSGVLYEARISVTYADEDLYSLSTSRYVSDYESGVN